MAFSCLPLVPSARRAACLAATVLGASCASSPPQGTASRPLNPAATLNDTAAMLDAARPLGPFASRSLAVTPAQHMVTGDSLGFAAQLGDRAAVLARVDDEIEFALAARQTAKQWQGAKVIARRMRNGGPYGVDAFDLGTAILRDPRLNVSQALLDPLASNLRNLIALSTESRYVLVPYELSFAGPKGAGRAILKLALIDARAARLVWLGVVVSDPAAKASLGLAASLGEHVADLVAAP